jgi:Signal transduction histidine kinase
MTGKSLIDLPLLLSGQVRPRLTQLVIAVAGIVVAVGLRLLLERIAPDVVPFALTFPVITIVTILAGARAGAITLIGCQILIWYAILPPRQSFAIESLTTVLNLLLVTTAQVLLLWAVASYRKTVRLLQVEDQRRIKALSLAQAEMDHRTKNNFQLAISLLTLQSRETSDITVKAALDRAVGRLQAMASLYKNLAINSADIQVIRLHDHLEEIIGKLRDAMLSPAIVLTLEAEPAVVRHDLAVHLGLIVNELVTNAAKHAFPEGVGTILVRLSVFPDQICVEISDNGKGLEPDGSANKGLGTKLVDMLVKQIGAVQQTIGDAGTKHIICVKSDSATTAVSDP